MIKLINGICSDGKNDNSGALVKPVAVMTGVSDTVYLSSDCVLQRS